jgi:hypothetical protein
VGRTSCKAGHRARAIKAVKREHEAKPRVEWIRVECPHSQSLFFILSLFLGLFSPRPQYVSRKTLAIKRGDSEILTRNDVQYAFLYHVFNDKTLAFTDETPGKPLTKVNFCDLYVHALYNSTKCSKVMRDKMLETPAFAIEFAKISLLTNVGRINTTMACMCYRSPQPHLFIHAYTLFQSFPR